MSPRSGSLSESARTSNTVSRMRLLNSSVVKSLTCMAIFWGATLPIIALQSSRSGERNASLSYACGEEILEFVLKIISISGFASTSDRLIYILSRSATMNVIFTPPFKVLAQALPSWADRALTMTKLDF